MIRQNILYVIENVFFGGGERAIAHVINGLSKERYKVFVACLTDSKEGTSGAFIREIEGNAQIIPLDMRNLFNLSNISKLSKIIKQNKIDLIHSQGARADFYVRMASRFAGKAALVSTVATPVEEYDINPFKKIIYLMIDRFGERFTDRFIAVAGHIEKKLTHLRGIDESKVVKINNGVDTEKYVPDIKIRNLMRDKLSVGSEVVLIGAVGRLTWEKGLSQFINAAKKIENDLNLSKADIKYLIAGTGDLRGNLEGEVDSLGLKEKFIFTGFIDDADSILNAMDVLVLPSLREGFPMVLLEAMSVGKPIIASKIDGVNESIIDGKNGILVEPGDSSALSEAIMGLLRDKEKINGMGQSGRKMALDKFNINRMISAHECLYDEVLKA